MEIPEALDLDLYYEDPDLKYVHDWHVHYTQEEQPEVWYHCHYGDTEHGHKSVDVDTLLVTEWGPAHYEDRVRERPGERLGKTIEKLASIEEPMDPTSIEWFRKYVSVQR